MADLEKAEAARTDYPNSKLAERLTQIFITSCVFGVFLDPLFLYIPLLNQDLKCLRLDNTIKIIALVSRSFTDLFYVGRIILQICRFENYSPSIKRFLRENCSSKLMTGFDELLPKVTELQRKENQIPSIGVEIWKSSIIVDILAILPLPQVAILFPNMRVSGSFGKPIINFLVMGQYVPRVLRIYLSCKKAKKPFKGHVPLWLKGLLNLFLYILASHVLGAFWYFLAAQQMISCWKRACRYGNGCGTSTFNCHDHQTLRDITVLNDLCPINPPNTTLFDFGIYLNVLQSGALWSTDYPLKFLNSFCWGLRNLSSLASNLQPSFYTWEIAFVAFISIIGLILFVYLIGNLQTYLQLDTGSLEKQRRKDKLKQKMEENDRKVESWLSSHGIPHSRKQKIMEEIQNELVQNSDFDVFREILSILPHEEINSCHPLSRLREVPLLKDMDEGVLIEISKKLKPEKYTCGQIIIEKDKTLEKKMLFIVDGRVTIEKTDGSRPELGAGKFYGEELLVSPSWTSSGDAKPINESVRATDDVQALVLSATDMATLGFSSKSVVSKFMKHFSNSASPSDILLIWLKKVPLLKYMDKGVLREISEKLKPEKYIPGQIIIEKDKTLEKMFFIVDGHVRIVNATHSMRSLGAGDFYGGELLVPPLGTSSSDAKPIINESVEAIDDVQALVLYATDMESISSKSKSIYKKLCMVTILKQVESFQQMDEQVLKAISKRLKPTNFNANQCILKEKKPLHMMFFVVRGVVEIKSESAMDVNVEKTCELGCFYGEELVHWVTTWVSHQTFPTKLPLSPDSALCSYHGGSVTILALKADDLKSVFSDFTLPTDSDQPRDWLTILKNVERLETMDEEVLTEICGYLELRTYEDAYIIQKDKPIEMMFFIMRGVVSVTDGSSKHYRNEGGRPNHSGDDLIEHWLQSKSTSVPAKLPTSPFSFWAIGEVEVLVLKAEDMAKVQPGDHIR
ncbi:cyclic nucleotide-gated ion channel 1-like [Prunus dulcis]|uniref:cyclic nucleotide-gated ion channel 1-like n=1 Tax=Prunus dulcis TaxID=3755 RepID=UPI0014831281|nr:cyclic nucleotide-gated ion channel 1-like [Prunus dulcis]